MEVRLHHKTHKSIINKVENFVDGLTSRGQSAGFYKRHRKANKNKVSEDIALGKYAEFIAAHALEQLGFPLVDPGLEIRKGKQKGWEVDLDYSQYDLPNCHVKNTPRAYENEYSWTFQLGDSTGYGGFDPLFNNTDSDELIVMMHVASLDNRHGKLMYTAPWNLVYPLLRDPFKKTLIGYKKCIYEADLI